MSVGKSNGKLWSTYFDSVAARDRALDELAKGSGKLSDNEDYREECARVDAERAAQTPAPEVEALLADTCTVSGVKSCVVCGQLLGDGHTSECYVPAVLALFRQQAQALAHEQEKVRRMCSDWAETHTFVENLCREHGVDVEGDGEFQCVEQLVERMAQALADAKLETDHWRLEHDHEAGAHTFTLQQLAAAVKERDEARSALGDEASKRSGYQVHCNRLTLERDAAVARAEQAAEEARALAVMQEKGEGDGNER
jgi:hypothetical protein